MDPQGRPSATPVPYDKTLDLTRRPMTIGLVANAFPDARLFVDCLEAALGGLLPGVAFKRYNKATVDPLDAEIVAGLAGECDAAIAAWGH